MLDINKCTLNIGVEKPFKILHITDSHIALCDERDNERKRAVLAGHIHFSFESTLENGITQYVTGGGYDNTVREITVI